MATVLVVDDEFAIAALLETVLEDEGYRVLKAGNRRQGLERQPKVRSRTWSFPTS
jgi:CheY-like chemotaxis protein